MNLWESVNLDLSKLKGKTVLLGVTGSIAAYKACDITSKLVQAGAEVFVVMTKNATHMVGEHSFHSLSGNAVITDSYDKSDTKKPKHIALAQICDCMLIAPATANIIGKIAHGIADDALSTIAMAFTKKIFIAPAMNVDMYNNKILQKNLNVLKEELGCEIIEPAEGYLACGDTGKGRLADVSGDILKILCQQI